MLTGGCQCGAVQFAAEGAITELSHCHCSICRRLHGAALVSFAGIPRAGFRWSRGEEILGCYASSAETERLFCGKCGSQLGCVLESDADHLYLAMAAIDGDPPTPPAFHQYTDSGVTWLTINDGLPRFPAGYTGEA